MEEIQKMENEEKETRWTTGILLIGNLIIWTIVLIIISVFYSLNVFAATLNPNTNQIQVKNIISGTETYVTIGQNQNYTVQVTETVPLFVSNWINLPTGVIDGKWSITFPVASGTTCNDLKQLSRFIVSVNDLQYNATKSFTACTISNNVASLQMKYNTTNTIANATFKTIYYVPGQAIGGTYKSYQQTDFVQKDYATNIDIENGVINIINNAIQNATNVMANQNNDTNALIDAIIAQNQTCEIINYLLDNNGNTGRLSGTGEILTGNGYRTSDFIKISSNTQYTITYTGTQTDYARVCFYNKDKNNISCLTETPNQSRNFTSPQNSYYIRYTILKDTTGTLSGKYCITNTEAIIENQNSLQEWLFTPSTPDENQFNTTHAMEDDILDMAEDIDLQNVEVSIDTESSNWVWTVLTSLINTSSLVYGMVISILSIGIIKLVLNR